PGNVNVYDVTETSAEVSWTRVLGAKYYNIIVLKDGVVKGRHDHKTSPFTIPNLEKGTTYEAFVHAQNEIDSVPATYEFTTKGPNPLPNGVVRKVNRSDLSWVVDQRNYPSLRFEDGDSIADSGCGLCATINAVAYLTGYLLDVNTVLRFWNDNGCHCSDGTYWSAYEKFASSSYGQGCGFYRESVNDTLSRYKGFIQEGGVIIMGCSRDRSSNKGGHVMAIVDYNKDTNKFLILDSAGTQQNHLGDYWAYTGSLSGWYTISEDRKIYGGSITLNMGGTRGYKRR
ncbi:MAG: fibronectin type III domain-containing protein, partial [Clostridia bacterium]|nr:fibronectin type III domain-containing protein [Clostridia bacterium]